MLIKWLNVLFFVSLFSDYLFYNANIAIYDSYRSINYKFIENYHPN